MAPRTKVDASEVMFRTICGMGWSLLQNLAELRALCEGKAGLDGWPAWIDRLQKAVIEGYQPSGGHPDIWIAEIIPYVESITKSSPCRDHPEIAAFLTRILLTNPDAHFNDIDYQLSTLNRRAHELAGEMLSDPVWSTDSVAARWNTIPEYKISYEFEAGATAFRPITDQRGQKITIKVEQNFKDFDLKFALLSYLTLEFQLLHEYVSHALPIWSDTTLDEVMLLSSTYDWYPHSKPPDGIRSFLANKRRSRNPDAFADWRDRFKDFADVVGRESYCRFILTLATIPDAEFSAAAKDNLVVKMSDLPLPNEKLHAEAVRLINVRNPDGASLEALRQHLPLPSR